MKSNIKELFAGCLTVPNLLSVIRIALIPVFGVLYYNGDILWAVIILFISGLTDFFDGKIARKFNQISALGKVLDPVADKLTQMTIAVLLYLRFNSAQDGLVKTFSWIFLVFIIKEFVMVAFGAFMVAIGLRPSAAEIYGKLSTFAFYAVMIFLFAFAPEVGAFKDFWEVPESILVILVAATAVLCVIAFVSYLPTTYRQFKEKYFSKK